MAVGYRCADIYLRFPEIAEDEFKELMEFIGDDSIVCRGATKYVRELEEENQQLKDMFEDSKTYSKEHLYKYNKDLLEANKKLQKQKEYYELLNKNKMYDLECTLRQILKFCNHLHNDCKYDLNDGHIRKIRNICKRQLEKVGNVDE